jgi:hypothetical protein
VTLVVLASHGLLEFPAAGGHFWVYLQYAEGLRSLGCDVWWLEEASEDDEALETLRSSLERFGFPERLLLEGRPETQEVLDAAGLLLNFNYGLDASARAKALVDIDPGLLQFWIERRQLDVRSHDVYFTTGERIGEPWIHIRPPVSLELWPYTYDRDARAFTTVSSWWGDEWVAESDERYFENNKRVSFLELVELPTKVDQTLELALMLGDGDKDDLRLLETFGWDVRHSLSVTSTPEDYRTYIQGSRGEFSCVKPSCLRFLNSWISDRSICYLASGKPVVVQDTGTSEYLPVGYGLLRFATLDEAAKALAAVDADYEGHCVAARELAETYFDARQTAERILDVTLG